MAEETINDDDTEETSGSRKMDPELKAIGAILRLLEDLDNPRVKARVVGYIVARYAGE